nr:hypothetical protein [Candidatus Cloacimonadota bacterium]
MKHLVILSIALLILTGCVSNSAYREQEERVADMENAIMQNSEELVVLRKEIMKTRQNNAAIAATDIEQLNAQMLQNEADMKSLVTEQTYLAQAVNELSGSVMESDRQIVQMIRDLELRINALSQKGLSSDQLAAATSADISKIEQNTAEIAKLKTELDALKEKLDNIPSEPRAAASEVAEYVDARDEYYKRNFNTAITKLDAFVAKYPNSDYAGNAVYWKGETYYAQSRFTDALREFQNVLARYPKSWKAGDSQFKIGLTYEQMGDHEAARTALNKVKTDYPKFERMDLVDLHLSRLK